MSGSIIGDSPLPGLLVGVGLYGAYVVLFGLSMWTTYHHKDTRSVWMRVPLILMFLNLTVVLALAIMQFDDDPSGAGSSTQTLPMQIGINVTTCVAGLLSDGLLAWRAFVIFGRMTWMKWFLIVVISTNFALGSLGNIAYTYEVQLPEKYAHLDPEDDYNLQALVAQWSSAAEWFIDAWAWIFFTINTSLTASIMYRIISATKNSTMLEDSHESRSIYRTVVRAIIESSLITWVVLLIYSISTTVDYATDVISDYNAAFLTSQYTFTALPFIFGISQSLIIARIGLARLQSPAAAASKHTAMVFADTYGAEIGTQLVIKGGMPEHDAEMGTGAVDSVCVARTVDISDT